jgi:SAM-dependent methyltransferase
MPQVEPEHYRAGAYDSKERFVSYWHQIDQILRRSPDTVLEVGIGNGFVHRYLKQHGVRVHTVDFDERLGPDTVASVLALPFDDASFDLVCCYETLEHLPWRDFSAALAELKRLARRWVLISLPDVTPYLRVDIQAGDRRRILRELRDLPDPHPPEHVFDGQHYWEIGKRGFSRRRVVREIEQAGLQIEEQLRVFELPYHRYFSCRTKARR